MNESTLSSLLFNAAINFHNNMVNEVLGRVRDAALFPPQEVQRLLEKTQALNTQLQTNRAIEIDATLFPLLKRALLDARLELANRLDGARARVSDPALVKELDRQLAPYDEIMTQAWFRETEAARAPQLTDFLTIESAERILARADEQKERQYDEKFHVLQAPALFLPDLDYYRRKCGMRNVPLVVAHMDIDDFKRFNSKHGESVVDLYLLPRFMAALEAHVYARGHAYRFGGDEYAVLMPNADTRTGAEMLADFQRRIERLNYQGIEGRPTVSIGFCEVRQDCHFTNREVLTLAVSAKNFAKEKAKNRIATFTDSLYQELRVLDAGEAVR